MATTPAVRRWRLLYALTPRVYRRPSRADLTAFASPGQTSTRCQEVFEPRPAVGQPRRLARRRPTAFPRQTIPRQTGTGAARSTRFTGTSGTHEAIRKPGHRRQYSPSGPRSETPKTLTLGRTPTLDSSRSAQCAAWAESAAGRQSASRGNSTKEYSRWAATTHVW